MGKLDITSQQAELFSAIQPLLAYLKVYHNNPHSVVEVSLNSVKVKQDEIGIPDLTLIKD